MLRLERWTEPLAESNCYLLGRRGARWSSTPTIPGAAGAGGAGVDAGRITPDPRALRPHGRAGGAAKPLAGVWVAAAAACSAGLGTPGST